MLHRLLLLGLLIMPISSAMAEDYAPIEALMNESELKRSGLGQLKRKEFEFLNQWLQLQSTKSLSGDVISSRIVGDFNGWRGKTLFELDNGQIWRQRYSGYWKVKLDHPEVSIKKNGSGAYEMELVSEGKKMGVKRVR